MMLTSRTLRLLDVVSLIVAVAALVVYMLPVSHASTPVAESGSTRAAPALQSFADAAAAAAKDASATSTAASDAATIVSANILSGTRRAPVVRYTSPDAVATADFSLPAAFAPSATDPTDDSESDVDAVPALFGIVNADGAWRALLRLDDADAGPVLLKEGDRRGSYRVVSIRSNAVVVANSSGQRTLRLARAPRNDSTGKSP